MIVWESYEHFDGNRTADCFVCSINFNPLNSTWCLSLMYGQLHTREFRMDGDIIVHNGGCHCRKVRWRVQAPKNIVVWDCNCSICSMRGSVHFIVPSKMFELLGDSKEFLTTYTFGTHTAKHTFCKVCGITSFYFPRSNPDGIAITFKCVDPGTLSHIEIKHYDGKNWEISYDQSGVASCSKLNEEVK
ncbi:centromere protein V [Melia azedarach]|uniref:Centromere protein V n=1 Tax=Melia azedarach TaxID=155640 RepID=A0ACC1X5X8_MELAZ|nr:centromere protein V [Melia azedarach]